MANSFQPMSEQEVPQAAYRFQEFPKMLYQPDGATRIVMNKAEEEEGVRNGLQLTPPPPKPVLQQTRGDANAAVAELQDQILELLEWKANIEGQMVEMAHRVEAMEAKKK